MSFQASATPAQSGFRLPSFPNTPFSFGPAQPASSASASAEQTAPASQTTTTTSAGAGLGGVLIPTVDNAEKQTKDEIKTAMETSVPAEVMQLVNIVKDRIKADRMAIEEITNFDQSVLDEVTSSSEMLSTDCGKALCAVLRAAGKAKVLRDSIRYDLRQAENAQCTYESTIPSEAKTQLQHLQRLCTLSEMDLDKLADSYCLLHKLIYENTGKPMSMEDLEISLRRMNESFKWIASHYYEAHDKLKSCLETVSRQNVAVPSLSVASRASASTFKGPGLGTSSFKNSLFGITSAMKEPAKDVLSDEISKASRIQVDQSSHQNLKLSNFFKVLNGARGV